MSPFPPFFHQSTYKEANPARGVKLCKEAGGTETSDPPALENSVSGILFCFCHVPHLLLTSLQSSFQIYCLSGEKYLSLERFCSHTIQNSRLSFQTQIIGKGFKPPPPRCLQPSRLLHLSSCFSYISSSLLTQGGNQVRNVFFVL